MFPLTQDAVSSIFFPRLGLLSGTCRNSLTRGKQMFNRHGLADAAGAILFQKAERRFGGLLAQHGVSNPSELPTALQEQILQRAIVETAAATFPTANIEMLNHGFRSSAHSAFLSGIERMKLSCRCV